MFWSQPRKDQLLYLKDVILDLDLTNVVAKYKGPYSYAFACFRKYATFGVEYPSEIEEQFVVAVWNKLKGFTKEKGLPDLSFEDFKQSLTDATSYFGLRIVNASPLIYYFESSLVPKFEIHYQKAKVKPTVDFSGIIFDTKKKTSYCLDPPFCSSADSQPSLLITKGIQLPSEFEELIGIAKEPKLIYAADMSHEEFEELSTSN